MSFPTIQQTTVSNPAQVIQAFNKLVVQLLAFFSYINSKPQLDSVQILNVSIKSGVNQIPHTLSKVLTNWTITDITSPAVIYRSAPNNKTTLTLTSSAACTINLVVS